MKAATALGEHSSILTFDTLRDPYGSGIKVEEFPACDQYTLQGDAFARAIQENTEVPVPLEDALKNMEVIEQILKPASAHRIGI